MNKDIYKIYQLMEFFTNKYSFANAMIKQYLKKNEVWITNPKNTEYNIIRISTSTLDSTFLEKERINNYIKAISKSLKMMCKFLDIHISNEEVGSNELFDTICLNTNFYSGKDVEYEFIGIKSVVHDVENIENEISSRISSINTNLKLQAKQARTMFKSKLKINSTSIIEFICILNFLLFYYLKIRYSEGTAYILVGADYKMLTLGANQYWRLISYAFVHSGFLHLFCNLFSLNVLGNFFESKYGTVKYLIILFSGIIVGALTNGVFTGTNNTIAMGLSGGIYALFACYVIEAVKLGAYNNKSFIMMILINIGLNFMPNVAWQAHLGGAIIGLLYSYAFNENKIDYKIIGLLLVVTLSLGYKYVTIKDINPKYYGTDSEIVKAYNDFGFKYIAKEIDEALYNIYKK